MTKLIGWGLDATIAKSCLATGKNTLVRTRCDGASQHAGRAVLIEVLNESSARIKPLQGHKKEEIVALRDLKLWKSANELGGLHMIDLELPTNNPICVAGPTTEYCIVSRYRKAIWCQSPNRWGNSPQSAMVFKSKDAAEAHCKHLASIAPDSQVFEKSAAFSIMGEFYPVISKSITHVNPQPIRPAPKLVDKQPSTISTLDIDIEAIIRGDDVSALLKALQDRRDAAKEVVDAQQLLQEAMAKLATAQATVARLTGLPESPQDSKPTPTNKPTPNSVECKRGDIPRTILELLQECSKLSVEAMVSKVQARLNLDDSFGTRRRITQSIYSLTSVKRIVRNGDNISLARS